MPGVSHIAYNPSLDVQVCTSTRDFPTKALAILESQPVKANLILPIFLKCRDEEQQTGIPNPECTWLVCYDSPARIEVEYIISCTKGMMGRYPIFIFTPKSCNALSDDDIFYAMQAISQALEVTISKKRVYSIFAVDRIAETFAAVWTQRTGIESYLKPYYDSTISFCSKRDIMQPLRQNTLLPGIEYNLCLATEEDIPEIGRLCEQFAAESEPFVLTPSQGQLEGELLVASGQVWVHRIQRGDEPSEIASIVAYTRNCSKVATITKVFTNPKWRRLGCAERLVRCVCKNLLFSTEPKEKIALFVGNDNPAAKVYSRVGFLGLDKGKAPVEGVERWLEIGFDRRKVQQGHW